MSPLRPWPELLCRQSDSSEGIVAVCPDPEARNVARKAQSLSASMASLKVTLTRGALSGRLPAFLVHYLFWPWCAAEKEGSSREPLRAQQQQQAHRCATVLFLAAAAAMVIRCSSRSVLFLFQEKSSIAVKKPNLSVSTARS